jgi:hypothetical protein
MSPKDPWNRNLAFTKLVFDHILIVRSPNSEATVGSKIWCSLCKAKTLTEYTDDNWVEHPKTSSILVLTSLRKEGKGLAEAMAKLELGSKAMTNTRQRSTS